MIKSSRHRGLKRLYERGDNSRIPAERLERIENILFTLDNAQTLKELRLPSFRLHALKGDRKGFWAVDVSGNWRIVFRFEDGDVFDVNYEDYH